MVDIAYRILEENAEPIEYRDLMNRVFEIKGFSQAEIDQHISHLYTDLNVDGRFLCVKRGIWGLCSWYPVDKSTDSSVAANIQDDFVDEELDLLDVEEDVELDDIVLDDDVEIALDDDFDDDKDDDDLSDEVLSDEDDDDEY